jgi:hypothetical protein
MFVLRLAQTAWRGVSGLRCAVVPLNGCCLHGAALRCAIGAAR